MREGFGSEEAIGTRAAEGWEKTPGAGSVVGEEEGGRLGEDLGIGDEGEAGSETKTDGEEGEATSKRAGLAGEESAEIGDITTVEKGETVGVREEIPGGIDMATPGESVTAGALGAGSSCAGKCSSSKMTCLEV